MTIPTTMATDTNGRTCWAPPHSVRWCTEGGKQRRRSGRSTLIVQTLLTFFAFFTALVMTVLALPSRSHAEEGEAGIIASGDLAVTGFSGTTDTGGQTFIDTSGASLKIFDVAGRGQARGQLVNAPVKFEAFARDIGQVFGIAFDNASPPNIYVTATAAHGLQIVIPDNNGDGVPERANNGQAGATFMEGQWGTAKGGGPGTVWRIDGKTGEIMLFANIQTGGEDNSGPGLGNITFDPAHFQFYVSDLDTGIVHRLDMAGNDLGTFDHGVEGRPAAGLGQVMLDPAKRMNIEDAAFDSENADTWGLADIRRRVWGLAYYKGRLYYAVADGPQIWSVGVKTDSSFAADARVEIQTVPGGFPVSDMLFTPRGRMIVAQRGGILGSQNYTQYHTPKLDRVLRYRQNQDGTWVQEPEEYAIGFPVDHKNASGGVGLACDSTLWSTGDALRNDPGLIDRLTPGGALVVHGLQGNKVSLVRPRNVPPWASWFVDYDGQFADPEKAGHVGDVEVYRNCTGGRADSWPGWTPIPEWTPPEGWVPPTWWPPTPDLDLEKIAGQCTADPAVPGAYLCTFTIVVTNVGGADFVGKIQVTDNVPGNAEYVQPPGGSIPWQCDQLGGIGTPVNCTSVNVETLHPGEAETLEITIRVTPPFPENIVHNCAVINNPDDPNGNNEDCADDPLPPPDLEIQKTFDQCVFGFGGWRCYFWIDITNVGGTPYTGPLHVVEQMPPGATFGGLDASIPPGWFCNVGPTIDCTLPMPPGVTMDPGAMVWIHVSIIIPFGQTGPMQNCVSLGNPEHAGDPVAPGVNEACAPFDIPPIIPLSGQAPPPPPPPPSLPQCPAGWTKQAPGWQPPTGWESMTVGSGAKAILCGRKRKEVHYYCPRGWTRFASAASVPEGWESTSVGRGLGAITCARPRPVTPPEPPRCPTGWRQVSGPSDVPSGWKMIVVDGIRPDGTRFGFYCAKPQPPTCRQGERTFHSRNAIPRGWKWRRVTRGRHTVYCAIPDPRGPKCRQGERTFHSRNAVPRDWTSRRVTRGGRTIYCAIRVDPQPCPEGTRRSPATGLCIPQPPEPPTCRQGERTFHSRNAVPRGWRSRRVTRGGRTIYCAIPGPRGPKCGPGERAYHSRNAVPRGWRSHRVTRGGRTIYCAKRRIVEPPTCIGGKAVLLKTRPPRWACRCPEGKRRVGNRCVSRPRSCPEGTRRHLPTGKCIPIGGEITPCPKNWRRVNGRCRPPIIECRKKGWRRVHGRCRPPVVTPCRKGWRRVNGRCRPPVVTPCRKGWRRVNGRCRPPVVTPCRKGWRRVNGRCRPPMVKPKPKPCRKGWRRVHGRCLPPRIKTRPTRPHVIHCPRGWHKVHGKCRPPRIKRHPEIKRPPRVKRHPKIKIRRPRDMKLIQPKFKVRRGRILKRSHPRGVVQ